MDRSIVGFHLDGEGYWVAELDCGHNQHVRHRPPFELRPWVLEEAGRTAHLSTPLGCPLCDRGELPEVLRFAWRSAEWGSRSLPTGLRRAHKLASGTWGRLFVEGGRLRFRASTTPPIDRVLGPGTVQAIPPCVEHEIEPDTDARLFVELLRVVPYEEKAWTEKGRTEKAWTEKGRTEKARTELDAAGDPACWAHLCCHECAGVLSEGHREGCSLATRRP